MGITASIIIILFGIILLLAEVFLIPGTGVAGIIGFALMVAGIYFAYLTSPNIGLTAATVCGVLSVFLLFKAFRYNTYDKLTLKKNITSKVNVVPADVKVGEQGKSLGRLAPTGKGLFGNEIVEVTTEDEFIDENDPLEIIRIEGPRIFVKKI